ncbi:hypothetical protein AVEN_34012-1 [Araneus ventricosus]|uniref:Uncharacterized protein n=1 Tax=Araneus ventricosus TaxID=182803 RepID=A0A4Y2TCD0_ARAVE|nr:hypothetical protein AVEN_34012-1 [Araneus ventricosus]
MILHSLLYGFSVTFTLPRKIHIATKLVKTYNQFNPDTPSDDHCVPALPDPSFVRKLHHPIVISTSENHRRHASKHASCGACSPDELRFPSTINLLYLTPSPSPTHRSFASL